MSEDGRHAVVQVQFDDNAQSVPVTDRALIPERGDAALADAGVTAHYSVEITQDTSLIGPGEVIGLTVALVVLVVVLGSLIAAGLPLLVALLGVGVGLAGAVAFTAFTDLNTMTPSLALMLGLAVGIDYALFIVNRHRAGILRGDDLHESIARSVATAGSAVVFAGATVVIALAALVLSGISILAQMGLVAAATVAVTVVVAVTVSPAVLALMKHRVVSRRGWRAAGFTVPGDASSRPVTGEEHEDEHGGWYVRLVTRRPWLTVLAVVALLGLAAVPVSQIQLGLPDGGSEATGTSAHTAYTTIADEFGPGVNGPIIAVATLPEQAAARTDAEVLRAQARIATDLMDVEGVSSVLPFGVSADQDTLAFQVVPTTGPGRPAHGRDGAGHPVRHRVLRPPHRHRRRPHRRRRSRTSRSRNVSRRPCPATSSSSSGCPCSSSCSSSARSSCRSSRPPGSCCRWARPSASPSRCTSGAGSGACSASPSPGRCCRSCRSSSSACSSASRWTTRCSSSRACTRRGRTGRTPGPRCARASSTAPRSSPRRRSS